MAFSKALSVLAASALTAQAFRIFRRSFDSSKATMFFEGVPVHRYSKNTTDFIMLFRQDATDQDISAVCQGACTFEGHPSEGGAGFAVVKGEETVKQLLKANKAKVELLEPDTSVEVAYASRETEATERGNPWYPWNLARVGVRGRPTTGKGVHIYVQDTGVRVGHKDFGGRAVYTLDLTGGEGEIKVCAESGGACARDAEGHGTHCAGTAAGTEYGVASDAAVHAVKTVRDNGTAPHSWQMMAFEWLAMNAEKPAVISVSLASLSPDVEICYSDVLRAVVEAGITVVVSAGGRADDACNYSPAYAPEAITVGATSRGNERAWDSNYGTCVDIWAPGQKIKSASIKSNDESEALSGNSMATPHVAGGAALLLEADPTRTRDEVWEEMKKRARLDINIKDLKGSPDKFLWVSTAKCSLLCSRWTCGFKRCKGCYACR